MVVKYDLCVVRRVDLSSSDVFVKFAFGIYVNDLTISFVSEKKT